MADHYFEEEEFSTQFNGKTVFRILAQTRPYWQWVVGFLVTVILVSFLDGYFTFLSKQIIDEGIVAGNKEALYSHRREICRADGHTGLPGIRFYLSGGRVGRADPLRFTQETFQ